MSSEPDPPWMRDAARAVGHELASYAATVRAIVTAPARFADDWVSGRRRALNPLAFMLNALAVLGPWHALCARVIDPNPLPSPIWFEMAKPVLPVIINVSVTMLFHALLRPLGARRPLRSSMAMALYVSGGPLAIVNFLVAPLALYGLIHRDNLKVALASAFANIGLLVCFFIYLIAMESSLHQVARWRATVAAILAWSCFAVLSGWVGLRHPELLRSLLEG